MAFYPIRRARLSPPFSEGIDTSNEFGRKVDWWWTPHRSLGAFTKSVGMAGIMANPSAGQAFGRASVCLNDTFTVVLLLAFPSANVSSSTILTVGSGDGFRIDTTTTGGGMYAAWTAQGVANGDDSFRDATGIFDTRLVVLVSDWSSSGQTSWWKRTGEAETTWTDSWNYAEPTNAAVEIGGSGSAASFIYGAMILRGNAGQRGARKLIADPWQMFL